MATLQANPMAAAARVAAQAAARAAAEAAAKEAAANAMQNQIQNAQTQVLQPSTPIDPVVPPVTPPVNPPAVASPANAASPQMLGRVPETSLTAPGMARFLPANDLPGLLAGNPLIDLNAPSVMPSPMPSQPGAGNYEAALRDNGLLAGPAPEAGGYRQWLNNAADNGVAPATLVDIARSQAINSQSFDVLSRFQPITDIDGKTFYQLPTDVAPAEARRAAVLTYVQNADTGYGTAGGSHRNDFSETPYSAQEAQRISDRQSANDWSYATDIGFVHDNGGRLAATPNGMLLGLGGNAIQDAFSVNGGTAWGDIFMMDVDAASGDAASQTLQNVIQSGRMVHEMDDGSLRRSGDLDRVLHHEEIHAQQYAERGLGGFLADYVGEAVTADGPLDHSLEQQAGLHDGGYLR